MLGEIFLKVIVFRNDKVKIIFKSNDLQKHGLTYEELDYSQTETRNLVNNGLRLAKKTSGFDIDGKSLFVELKPDYSGGCQFIVTKLKQKINIGEQTGEYIAKFSSFDKTADAKRNLRKLQSENFYFYRNTYFYLFEQDFYEKNIAEFADSLTTDTYLASFIREHGTPLFS